MKLKALAIGIALAVGAPLSASAATVTLDGDWFDVQYDDSIVGMWGVPTLIGNTLKFNPTNFKATAIDPGGANIQDFTSGTVVLKVIADDGYYMTGAALAEGGDYFKYGGPRSNVNASGELRVTSLSDGSGTVVGGISTDPAFPFPANPAPGSSLPWTAAAEVAVGGQVTMANVTIQNLLLAWAFNADPGSSAFQGAFIEKKNVALTVGVAPIPEPATWAMMATGAILLGFGLRRNRG